MLNSYYQRRKGPLSEINVVPYIDVMLVLLIIFMVTTPFLSQGIKVTLPQASTEPLPTRQKPIIISIDLEGRYYLNRKNYAIPMDALQLTKEVVARLHPRTKKKTQQVFVRGDQKVDYGKVVELMALLQKIGVVNIGLLTTPQTSC